MRAIEGDRAALVNALGLCGVDASALPITDEAKLRLGDHARHSEDHAAHIVLSRGGWHRVLSCEVIDIVNY